MIRHSRTRPAFTLVELLVALALGIALLGIAVAVSQSSAFDSYKVVGAGDRVSQWMLIAKNRALRDKAPRGVRFIIDPSTGLCREVAYIEQPEPWLPTVNTTIKSVGGVPPSSDTPRLIVQRIVAQSPPPVPGAVDSTRVFLINVPDPSGAIAVGDTLYLPELGQSYLIAGLSANPVTAGIPNAIVVNPSNPAPLLGSTQWPPPPTTPATANVNWQINSVVELTLIGSNTLGANFGAGFAKTDPAQSPSTTIAPTYHTTNFAVYRQPRPLMGLPTEQLPSGMVVDFSATPAAHPVVRAAPVLPATVGLFPVQFDVLFAPSGEVIGSTSSLLAFVLRDANLPNVPAPLSLTTQANLDVAGQMILVCLYAKTGAISTQPVSPPNPPPADPYRFAKDGLNTGL